LREQAVSCNQGCGLKWRDDVKPGAGYDESHREPGKPADKTASEGRQRKYRPSQSIHESPSRKNGERLDGKPI
jgi:hypothetical protein